MFIFTPFAFANNFHHIYLSQWSTMHDILLKNVVPKEFLLAISICQIGVIRG